MLDFEKWKIYRPQNEKSPSPASRGARALLVGLAGVPVDRVARSSLTRPYGSPYGSPW
jgi:hypothetical protein